MNIDNTIFSKDTESFFRSPVRDIFKKVDLNSIYSFAGGYPSAETFPLEQIKQTMSEVIDKYAGKAFQYGATQGVQELREAVAARYGVPVERVQITSSSQQGIDVCTRVLVNPGDVILGDIDGVLVVPREIAYEVLIRAEEIKENEKKIFSWVHEGQTIQEIKDKGGYF